MSYHGRLAQQSELGGPRQAPIYYRQSCPACGRPLLVRVEHLGQRVACQHCRRRFTACDPHLPPAEDSSERLLQRAETLLAQFDAQRRQ